ncbi:BON domain-containing protein [Pedobacter sp. Du54]|uniref:BON domain-containing protein n=1 Tax=Pedobacter anseongensis TaxID=3133439 RepID=UPI0030AD26B7
MKDDIKLQKEVMDEFSWEPSVNSARIGVTVNNGSVTLLGQVDHYNEKRRAEKVAERIAGVKAVVNELKVGLLPEHQKTDADIQLAVKETLKWHSAVEQNNIHVNVENGIVTLSGIVEWKYQRTAIERVVSNLIGVKSIRDQIQILPIPTTSDLGENIQIALKRSAILNPSKVMVNVNENKVLLKGKVRSLAQSEAAEDVAWAGPGVLAVDNKLDIDELTNDF